MDEIQRSRIAVTGTGNVAAHLMRWLATKGINALQVNPRTLEGMDPNSDICIIAVSDIAIDEVARKVDCMLENPDAIIAHTSGTTPLSILTGLRHSGAVLYPMQTFTKDRTLEYDQIPLFIEGSTSIAAECVSALAHILSSSVEEVDSDLRACIHLGAVFACNFLNFMLAMADESIKESKLNLRIYEPLIKECVDKAMNIGPIAAQTGPAKRGDTTTMKAHLDLLRSRPEAATLYNMISNQILSKYK